MRDVADGALVQVVDCRYGRMLYLTNDSYIGHALAKHGEYSESEVSLWRSFVEPHWIVADVGANQGAHTVALAQMVPEGRVGAFEPLQFLYHMLCGNLALNGITNVVAQNVAVGREAGTIRVPYADYTLEGLPYGGMILGAHAHGRVVPVVTLDAVMPFVDFIKLDVEGMELEVLQGAERHLAESRPVLYVEANPGPQQAPLLEFIRAHDYEMWWDHAAHFNPHNYRGEPENDLPAVPAPAVLAFARERMPDVMVKRERVVR